jgi:hypothetical protein
MGQPVFHPNDAQRVKTGGPRKGHRLPGTGFSALVARLYRPSISILQQDNIRSFP